MANAIQKRKKIYDHEHLMVKLDKLISNTEASIRFAEKEKMYSECIAYNARLRTLKEVRTVIGFDQYGTH
jgi:hypothetical protein